MKKLQTELKEACDELGLKIIVPFKFQSSTGKVVNAEALLPQLGAKNGMIIVRNHKELEGLVQEIQDAGYGFSVMGDPLPSLEFDPQSYMAVFTEWGWSGDETSKPSWIK